MTGVILAAGIASRLRPFTDEVPKCLLQVGGRSILGRTLDNIVAHSVREIVVVTGYRAELIREFARNTFPGLTVRYVHNEAYHSTNNIYSLWLASQILGSSEILLLDSDIVFDENIIGLLTRSEHESCLAMKLQHALGEEEMKVRLGPDGSIREIGKRIPTANASGESIGIEKFGVSGFNAVSKILDQMIRSEGQVDVFYEAAFQRMIDSGGSLYAVDVGTRRCVEIDTKEDLEHASRLFSPRTGGS